MISKVVFVIQARSGSTRLPKKVLRDFYEGKTILDIILTKMIEHFGKESIVLATSVAIEDNAIEVIGTNYGVRVFRGSESNVLSRFLGAAKQFDINRIVRVCADNPFLSMEFLRILVDSAVERDADYVSFKMSNGRPTILSHIGLFAEYVSRDCLEKVSDSTQESVFLEHVTNYVYSRPQDFNVVLLDLPDYVSNENNIRLTCDTQEDFELLQEIYRTLKGEEIEVSELLHKIKANQYWIDQMKMEINKNKK
ncbi:MAG: glycosyl transferase family 2 [Flavobacteriales bacterium]|nr:glycosyl transferase family 2 [Flavobacteriales bacterium]